MDVVEILLCCVVGFSVFVFLVVNNNNLDSVEERRKTRSDQSEKSGGAEKQIAVPEGLVSNFDEDAQEEEEEKEEEGFVDDHDDDDDWEGVERTELEEVFGKAVFFVSSNNNGDGDRIEDEKKLELYGLQKIALEGPCYGSQPMAFMLSARSKWNAWQKLGNMSREMAMEKYIDVLSKSIPDWKGEGTVTIQDTSTSEDQTFIPENKYGGEDER